jgi:hypothetical protein
MAASRDCFTEVTNLEVAVTRDFGRALPRDYSVFLYVMLKYSNIYAAFLIYAKGTLYFSEPTKAHLDAWLREIKRAETFIEFKRTWRNKLPRFAQEIPETAVHELGKGEDPDALAVKSDCVWARFAEACKNYSEQQYDIDKKEIKKCRQEYRNAAKIFQKKQIANDQAPKQSTASSNWFYGAAALVAVAVVLAAIVIVFFSQGAGLVALLGLMAAFSVSMSGAVYCLKRDRAVSTVNVKSMSATSNGLSTFAALSNRLGFAPTPSATNLDSSQESSPNEKSDDSTVQLSSVMSDTPTAGLRVKYVRIMSSAAAFTPF